MIVACAAMMASCNNGKTASTAETADSVATDSLVFEGLIPSADGAGISYRLAIAADKGFSLTESYMKSETEADTTFSYSGTAVELKKTVDGAEKTYCRLPTSDKDTLNFMVVNDSTLRMVSADFAEAVVQEGMSYDLKLKK